jgi:hypothetical protein
VIELGPDADHWKPLGRTAGNNPPNRSVDSLQPAEEHSTRDHSAQHREKDYANAAAEREDFQAVAGVLYVKRIGGDDKEKAARQARSQMPHARALIASFGFDSGLPPDLCR